MLRYGNGCKYSGNWKHNKRIGNGVLETPEGSYIGKWVGGLMEDKRGCWEDNDGNRHRQGGSGKKESRLSDFELKFLITEKIFESF